MIQLAVFDLDGTLAPVGGPIPQRAAGLLLTLEKRGVKIALCSGKPVYYLSGLARQIGLEHPFLLGENGAVLQVGNHLPPALRRVIPVAEATLSDLKRLRTLFEERLGQLWYQPNEICLTPFPAKQEEFAAVEALLEENKELMQGLTVYRHSDCFDICPREVCKKNGVKLLCSVLGCPLSQVAAVGDGENDYSMFEIAALSLGIAPVSPQRVDRRFDSVIPALEYLLEQVTEKKENTP